MFHFNNRGSGQISPKSKQGIARSRSKFRTRSSSDELFVSTSEMTQTGTRGMSQSQQQTELDLRPLLAGFLYHREDKQLIDIYYDIYNYDAIAGSAVDLMSAMPFSGYSLSGFQKPEQRDVFMESISRLNLATLLPEMSVDYLVTGTFVGSLIFDQERKIFADIIPQAFKNLKIQTLPFYGFDPIIEVTYPKEMIALLNSNHPRIKIALDTYGKKVINNIKSGKMELDPMSTIYLARKTKTTSEGISFFRRILPLYFLEKNIFRGTLLESIKRQRAILHITLGDMDWEPTDDDLEYITEVFTNADADPLGAVVATRSGVSPSEVRSPSDFWSIGTLWNDTNPMKLKAMGISEGFLSGEANFAVVDSAMTTFMESLQDYRNTLTQKVFTNKLFPLISLVNDYYKDDLSKKKVNEIRETLHEHDIASLLYKIQDTSVLMIPHLSWEKNLRPAGDDALLGHLNTLKEAGVPIPLRMMSAAGGTNIDNIMSSKEDDLKLHKEISEWQAAILALQPTPPANSGSSEFGASSMLSSSAVGDNNWVTQFKSLLTVFDQLGPEAQESILSGNPYTSDVLNTVGKKSILDRDYGDASEAYRLDANGKKHWITNQREHHTKMDDLIIKSIRSKEP